MLYLNSNSVRVFPTTQRESFDPAAKFTTEYNLTSLINRLLDTKAFVVDDSLSIDDDGKILSRLEFNIMGYYFFIEDVDLTQLDDYGQNKYLNAAITITENQYNSTGSTTDDGQAVSSTLKNWWQLNSTDQTLDSNPSTNDTNYRYTGLKLAWKSNSTISSDKNVTKDSVTTVEDGVTGNSYSTVTYEFTILQKGATENTYIIPAESKIRFKTTSDGKRHSVTIDDGCLD